MSTMITLAEVTLRALLGRRRTILLLLLASLPVLVGLLARIGGGRLDEEPILDGLLVRTVLPLTALVFGTSALGTELEDGTATYLLVKPIPRWQIVFAKIVVAGALGAALTAASSLLTGLLVGGVRPIALGTTVAVAVASALAALGYVSLFVALSVLTSRALILGLIYVLVWEGLLAGILDATKIFSIREATLGIAHALAPAGNQIGPGLESGPALLLVVGILVGGFVVGSVRLVGYEVRSAE
jgi:ABC-2 type transport system permease protein